VDRLNRYASWIVENQDKQGTTEFETVANAYKQLRGAPGVPAAPIAPSPARPLPDASERNLLREAVVDPAAQVFKGAATGVRFLTDVLGADNPISRTVGGAEDFFDSLLSAQSKRDQQEVARILEEAEDKGLGDQIKAGLQALTVAPVDLIANAFGTSVPTLAAGLLGGATRVGAGAIATGVGALTGVGITKSAVYEAVLQELVSSGVSEENAKEAAKEAQAYGGENLDNIALGGALGALAARFGLEDTVFTRAIGRRLAKEAPEKGIEEAAKSGVIARASRKALEEAIPEALQGGQEQFAQNIALQREGFDTPTFRGVAAGATLEGAVGAPVGAIAEAAPELASRAQKRLKKEINLVSLEEAKRLVDELARETDVEREEVKAKRATEEELNKFLEPLIAESKQEKEAKAQLAKELEREVDDPVVEREFNKRLQAARDEELGIDPQEEALKEEIARELNLFVLDPEVEREFRKRQLADPANFEKQTQLEAQEKIILRAAGPEASLREEQFIEDVLAGENENQLLQRLAESILDQDTKNFIEGRRQGREDALAGLLGEEAQQRAEERQRELEEEPEEVITLETQELTDSETQAIGAFLAKVNEANLDKNEAIDALIKTPEKKVKNRTLSDARKTFLRLQETESQAYDNYRLTVKKALAGIGKPKDKDIRDFFEAENRGTVSQLYPDLTRENLIAIAAARKDLEDIQENLFIIDPTIRRIVDKKGVGGYGAELLEGRKDPSADLVQEADEEGIEQFYNESLNKLKVKEEDLATVERLQGTKPAKGIENEQQASAMRRASKYFKLPTVSKNPARALAELAYDLAHDPSAVVERIQKDSIRASIQKMPATAVSQRLPGRAVGRLTDKSIKQALKGKRVKGEDVYRGLEAGLLRGEGERTELKTQQTVDAVNYIYFDSPLSVDTKQNFLNLVTEFRNEYIERVRNSATAIQLEDRLQKAEEKRKKADTELAKQDKAEEKKRKQELKRIRDTLERRLTTFGGRKSKVKLNDFAVLRVLEGEATIDEVFDESVFATVEQAQRAEELEQELNDLNTAKQELIEEAALREVLADMQKAYPKAGKFTVGRSKEFDRRLAEKILEFSRVAAEIEFTPEKLKSDIQNYIDRGGVIQKGTASKGIDPDTYKVTTPKKQYKLRKATIEGVDPEFEEYYDFLLDNDAFEQGNVFDGKTSLSKLVGKPVSKFSEALYEGSAYDAIGEILKSTPNELRPLIRRMRNMARDTSIEIRPLDDAEFGAKGEVTGAYFYEDNVIVLDPDIGLTKGTLLHELSHAALDSVLENQNSEQVKQLFDFYSSIKTQMGDAYGGEDLYEFVAELVGNSEFQNLLKEIKAPKSKSLWETIIEAILNFFGVRKGQTAYDESLKFLNDIITARPPIEPNSVEKVFLANTDPDAAMKEAIEKFPPFRPRRIKEAVADASSTMSDTALTATWGGFRLDNLNEMFGDKLKALKDLISNIEKRQAKQEKDIESINKKYNAFKIISEKHKPAYEAMSKFAIDMSRARVDIFDAPPNPLGQKVTSEKAKKEVEEKLKIYKKGKATYEKIGKMEGGKAVQDMYKAMRGDYDRMYVDYRETILSGISNPRMREQLKERFAENPPIAGYMPLRRYGDFVLIYKDKDTGERTVLTFESRSQRDREINALNLTQRVDIQKDIDDAKTKEEAEELKKKKREADLAANEYFTVDSIKDLSTKTTPPEGFVADTIDAIKQSQREIGLSERQIEKISREVYENYIDFFPDNSLMQSFRSREDTAGASTDVVRTYGDTMIKWSRKLADLEYNPEISNGFNRVRAEGAQSNDKLVRAAAQNIGDREDFTLNPVYNDTVRKLTSGSYFLFMSGNISSALVNLSSVPLLSYPILASRHGAIKTAEALKKAGAVAVNDWSKNAKYATLYKTLDDHGQLRHTLEREVLEGARQATEDYNTIWAKSMSFLSFPISATERLNRATTGIMAYDLMKAEGKSDQEAADYALKIVKDVNTSGMSTTAPKWMQSNVGRVAFTFKGFIWQSTYVTARAFVQATRGQDSETKKQAFKQLLYMYGISFAVGGTFGLPLFGLVSTLAEIVMVIAGSFDDEEDAPFNAKKALREMGLSHLVLKGPLNEYLNIEVSNRASIANGIGFREEPYDVDKYGRGIAYGLQLLGPSGSYVLDGFETVPKAFEDVRNFELGRGIERLAPSWLRNGIKTNRFLQEGARTRDGRPIDTDVNAWNLFMQALGFTPADVSDLYEVRSLGKSYENRVLKIRSQLLKERYLGITTGDTELLERANTRINNFRRIYPRLITNDTLDRSFKSRRAAEREYISGIRYSRNFRRELDPLFRSMDNITYYGGFS